MIPIDRHSAKPLFHANSMSVGASKNVTTATTAVQLSATSVKNCYVWITAKSANTGYIYVGFSDVDNASPIRLSADASIVLGVEDLNKLYLDASVSGEGVNFAYLT